MKKLKLLFLAGILALLAGCSSNFEGNMKADVQDFTHVNQNGENVSLADLKGKVWIADFIFTSCKTVCPPMTKNMSDLQKMLAEENINDVTFVSFSVDPQVDTPEALKSFISNYEADEESWHLLTGYDEPYIRDFAQTSFQTLAIPDPNSDQVTHGTSFYLVNGEGTAVKSYNGSGDVPFDEILADVKKLTEQKASS